MTEHRIEVIIFFSESIDLIYACMDVTTSTCKMILNVSCSLNESAVHCTSKKARTTSDHNLQYSQLYRYTVL